MSADVDASRLADTLEMLGSEPVTDEHLQTLGASLWLLHDTGFLNKGALMRTGAGEALVLKFGFGEFLAVLPNRSVAKCRRVLIDGVPGFVAFVIGMSSLIGSVMAVAATTDPPIEHPSLFVTGALFAVGILGVVVSKAPMPSALGLKEFSRCDKLRAAEAMAAAVREVAGKRGVLGRAVRIRKDAEELAPDNIAKLLPS